MIEKLFVANMPIAGFAISFFETKPYVPTVALNYNTIAYMCAQEQGMVAKILQAAFLGIVDLIRLDHDLELDFGPAVFRCCDKLAEVRFKPSLTELVRSTAAVRRNPSCATLSCSRFAFCCFSFARA